jgi:Uma2 family endonuclease
MTTAQPATHLLTADDLWQLPDDGNRHELVKGELRTMPPAGFEHGATSIKLSVMLGRHAEANGLGQLVAAETGFLIAQNPDTVRAPDIGFVRQQRIQAVGMTRKFWPEAPDLAVEVLSPSDTVNQVDEKVEEWLSAGTSLVWVVNPRQRTVTVHRPGSNPVILSADDTLHGADVLPGFQCLVREVFP